MVADLARCQEALFQITGSRPRYYRPAVGIRNPVVHQAARRLGLTIVTWTHAARDGLFAMTAQRAKRLAGQVRPGSIVALHDGSSLPRSGLREQTVENLPLLLEQLSARGFRLGTLSELLGGGADLRKA